MPGCVGTTARLTDEGWQVNIPILAEGATSRDAQRDRTTKVDELSALAMAARRAAATLEAASVRLHDFPDNRMNSVDLLDVEKLIESQLARRQPRGAYTHHRGDVNIEHVVIHETVLAACRPQPGAPVRELLSFEVASSPKWRGAHSSAAFCPNVFVDFGNTLDRKLQVLKDYASEMRTWPHARSVTALEHLARWRGASVSCAAAEAFELGRRVE